MKHKQPPQVRYKGEMLILDYFNEADCNLLLRNLTQSYEGRLTKALVEGNVWTIDFSKVNSSRAKAGKVTYSMEDVCHYINQVWLRTNPVKGSQKRK